MTVRISNKPEHRVVSSLGNCIDCGYRFEDPNDLTDLCATARRKMTQTEQVKEWRKQGHSTGEIALKLGWERTPASRKKIRKMLSDTPLVDEIIDEEKKTKKVSWKGERYESGERDVWTSHERVQRSTGHREYMKRKKEAQWILGIFEWNDCKIKGKDAEFLLELDLDNVSPDEIFRLRDMMSRRKLSVPR